MRSPFSTRDVPRDAARDVPRDVPHDVRTKSARRPARRPARCPTRRPPAKSNRSSSRSRRRQKFGSPQLQRNPRAQLRSHAWHVHEDETEIDFPVGVACALTPPTSNKPLAKRHYAKISTGKLRFGLLARRPERAREICFAKAVVGSGCSMYQFRLFGLILALLTLHFTLYFWALTQQLPIARITLYFCPLSGG